MPISDPNLGEDIRNSLIGKVTEIAQFTISDYRHHKDKIAQNRAERAQAANANANEGAGAGLAGNQGGLPNIPLPPDKELADINTKANTNYKPRKLVFKVQFNPSELSLNTSALAINKQSVLLHADKIEEAAVGATANLNVSLIFDKMNELDSFIMDNGALSAAAIAAGIGTAVKLKDGYIYSVKPEVEALLAALRDENTRQAEFRWNDFVFDGYLQYVQVRYTMFSPAGHPVRAVVAIRMKREATIQDEWVKDFDIAFSGAGGQLLSRTQKSGLANL